MKSNVSIGKDAEDFLAIFLSEKSWLILSRNFRRRGSEIDLIASKGNTLIFVEVKYRSLLAAKVDLDILEKIFSPSKQQALQRGISAYIQENPEHCYKKNFRIDLALLTDGKTKGSKQIFAYYPNAMHLKDAN